MDINLAKIDFCPGQGGGSVLQEKTTEILLTETSKIVTPDSGYDGMSKVTVTHAPVETSTSVSISTNGSHTITPGEGYDATMQVIATVNVPEQKEEETFNVTPSTVSQTITPTSGKVFSSGTVGAVTSSIDSNIQAGNIKKDVQILGVTGTLEEGITPTGTLSISNNGTYDVTNYASANVNVGGTDYRNQNGSITGLADLGWDAASQGYANANIIHYTWENSDYVVSQANKDLYGVVTENNRNDYKNNTDMVYLPYFETSGRSRYYYFYQFRNIKAIPLLDTSSVTDMSNMFSGCSSLITIPLLDTSSVTDMFSMFSGCSSLTTIPLLDTSSVTEMRHMFSGCTSLTTIPLLDTSSVTNMYYMFNNCSSLTSIPLLDTSSVTNMYHMFYDCSSLTSIPLLDTSSVTEMHYMFTGCSSLTSIPLLDTSSVNEMYLMFSGCSSLTSIAGIDFTGIGTSIDRVGNMFKNCSSLTHIIVNGSISFTWNGTDEGSIKSLTKIDYDSVKSILTAMSNCTNPETAKIMAFNRAIQDPDRELAALIADCVTKGWTITGLITYTEIPNVYYTTSDGQVMSPATNKPFGNDVNITSNTYVDGQGIMVLDNLALEVVRNGFRNDTLVSMVVPYGVGRLGWASFADYTKNLTTIDLPSTLYYMDSYVFSGSTSLTTVTVRATVPPNAMSTIFNACSSLAHIYVPAGSVDAYKAANTWSNYASKISAIPE